MLIEELHFFSSYLHWEELFQVSVAVWSGDFSEVDCCSFNDEGIDIGDIAKDSSNFFILYMLFCGLAPIDS